MHVIYIDTRECWNIYTFKYVYATQNLILINIFLFIRLYSIILWCIYLYHSECLANEYLQTLFIWTCMGEWFDNKSLFTDLHLYIYILGLWNMKQIIFMYTYICLCWLHAPNKSAANACYLHLSTFLQYKKTSWHKYSASTFSIYIYLCTFWEHAGWDKYSKWRLFMAFAFDNFSHRNDDQIIS